MSQDDVLYYGEPRDEHEVLVDHADSQRESRFRRPDADLATLDLDRARVRLVHAVEDVHDRGLTGPVLAQQRVDLSPSEVDDTPSLATTPGKNLEMPSSRTTVSPDAGLAVSVRVFAPQAPDPWHVAWNVDFSSVSRADAARRDRWRPGRRRPGRRGPAAPQGRGRPGCAAYPLVGQRLVHDGGGTRAPDAMSAFAFSMESFKD